MAASVGFLLILGAQHVTPAGALPDGAVDTSFGTGGLRVNGFGNDDLGRAVAMQSNGKIVVAGDSDVEGTNDFLVLRYSSSGALDTAFGDEGKVVTDFFTGSDRANAIAIQEDQKIVVGGSAQDAGEDVFALARYNANGTLDTTFSDDGKKTTSIGGSQAYVQRLLIQPDGKIVAVGYAYTADEYQFTAVRYNPGGGLDSGFGTNGIATISVGYGSAFGGALQGNGKIVLAGYSGAGDNDDYAVVRLNADGSLDTGFGTDGVVTFDFLVGDDVARAVAIRSGKIVVAGTVGEGSGSLIGVALLDSGGSLDSTFDSDGKLTDAWNPDQSHDEGFGVAFQTDGKIVVAGYVDDGTSRQIAVARYASSGARDSTFGSDGLATLGSDAAGDEARAVVIQPNARIVVAGVSYGATYDVAVGRFIGDGTSPTAMRMTNVPRYSLRRTRTMTWTASDEWTGVKSYDVQRRAARYDASTYGSWSKVFKARMSTSGSVTGKPGRTYCFRVRARDVADNLSAYSSPKCMAIPLDERSMNDVGSWVPLSNSRFYLGTALRSTHAGDVLKIGAVWRHLAVVVTTCPGCGRLKVYRGSTLLKTIDLDSGTTRRKRVIEVSSSASVRSGTVKLRQSSGGDPVIVEGLAVSLA